MSRIIEPEPGNVLVELPESEYGDIPVPPKSHDSLTWGLIVAVSESDEEKSYLVGRVAYWRKYKDDARVGKNLALIELRDIMGTSYETDLSNNG